MTLLTIPEFLMKYKYVKLTRILNGGKKNVGKSLARLKRTNQNDRRYSFIGFAGTS